MKRNLNLRKSNSSQTNTAGGPLRTRPRPRWSIIVVVVVVVRLFTHSVPGTIVVVVVHRGERGPRPPRCGGALGRGSLGSPCVDAEQRGGVGNSPRRTRPLGFASLARSSGFRSHHLPLSRHLRVAFVARRGWRIDSPWRCGGGGGGGGRRRRR